ncbi:MAG: glycosyltransferase family 9 protein [Verrucomicrobia bacterium]|nr:glycosyltransferase family 9 protein [Verrucomicrobiota bacterium]
MVELSVAPLGKILVIRGGAIGDFILTLPALAALRAQFPGVRMELLGYPHIAELARAVGLVDAVKPIESRALASFFARGGDLPTEMTNYFAGFALVVSYLFDPDGIFQTNVTSCTAAQFIAGPHRPNEGEFMHATEVFLKPLERLAIFGAEVVPRLRMTAGEAPARPAAPTLACHPGSGSEKKNWPEPQWAALLDELVARTEANLLIVGGEAEGKVLERLAAKLSPERVRIARSVPLPELARLLAGCDAFLGHDSGITHLAAAVGLPGVVLWGVSNAVIWRPPSPRMEIVRQPGGLAALSVNEVLARVRKLLDVVRK